MTQDEFINYGQLIDDAMHIIVKRALEIVVSEGLPGDHHFFISFLTDYPGVQISQALKQKYPEEMTIVLQYQFQDLYVDDNGFGVTLSFNNVNENLVIPFGALTAFADPSVKFGLQFRHMMEDVDDDMLVPDIDDIAEPMSLLDDMDDDIFATNPAASTNKDTKGDNVIALDNFRKKPK